jgi:hypothetical protein
MRRVIINQIVQEKLKKNPDYSMVQRLQQLLDQEINGDKDMHKMSDREADH